MSGVAAGEAAGQQLGHHGLLHDLELVDDRLRRLDGLVHRRQNRRDLPLLGEIPGIRLGCRWYVCRTWVEQQRGASGSDWAA